MNEKINEQIIQEQNAKIKRSSNKLLIGVFLLFIFGYVFFLTSTIWMPVSYENIQVTPIGHSVSNNDRKVTLLSWSYDDERKEQEVIIDIQNGATDGMDYYSWSAVDINKGQCKVEAIVEEEDFVVLRIYDIHPRWTEISLRMNKDKKFVEDVPFVPIKFYTSKEAIQKVSGIRFGSAAEYRRIACDRQIDIYEAEMDELFVSINSAEETMRNADKRIVELKGDVDFQSEAEKTETYQLISTLEGKIASAQNDKDKAQAEIRRLQEQIELQKKKQELYSEDEPW